VTLLPLLSADVQDDIDEALRYKAEFCLASEGAVSSSEYDDMTPAEVQIWAAAINKRNK
jgi:hypothetical protein